MIDEKLLFFVLKLLDKIGLANFIKILKLIDLIRNKCPNISNEQLYNLLAMINERGLSYKQVKRALRKNTYSYEELIEYINNYNPNNNLTLD